MRFPRGPRIDEGRKFYVWLVVFALLVAYAVAFILENDSSITVHFVFATAHVSLVWLILLALAVGLVAGLLLPKLERRRRRRRSHEPTQH